ncbi:DUF817 domain-containing protein [Tumebacillus permanentifrigoris]|uniref:Uncharacterized membrane protein YoaT (DUF817 family) n=1 Tax=Tumebacillus permanentifrigoris TaxID=378543 RepID=A0A316DBU8_9BACL|nr:DUF817 domain-containing protein [Tumebacillus permanentifrigoris]PWK15617.1 uncharacterized membrane protein YoaT (DUF817 family) [Tumebacillus permanentifrigoris]
MNTTRLRNGVLDLAHFTYQEAMSCLFAVFIFGMLAISHKLQIPGLHRYDLLLIACLLMQVLMYKTGLETKDEVKVIAVFHLIGLALELFKVQMGSWAYPEPAWSKIAGVPLYSGFMYASVASYVCQAWRRLDMQLSYYPKWWLAMPVAAAGYLNFFTHHYIGDYRWWILLAVVVVFWRTRVLYQVRGRVRSMPLVLAFFLVGLFIYFGENIATFYGAWQYPDQKQGWHLVDLSKISSWFLLIIVEGILVAQMKRVKANLTHEEAKRQTSAA